MQHTLAQLAQAPPQPRLSGFGTLRRACRGCGCCTLLLLLLLLLLGCGAINASVLGSLPLPL